MDLDGLLGQVSHPNRARVRSDVASLTRRFGSLSCCLGKHTANDGTEATLLAVEGTLPITYKGSTYNIPVEILVPEGYPAAAPLCFVRPVKGMEVRTKIPLLCRGLSLLRLIIIIIIIIIIYNNNKDNNNDYYNDYSMSLILLTGLTKGLENVILPR